MNRWNGKEIEAWLADAPAGAPVYLVGIGGCGMSGLAHLLLDLGFAVHGSDLQINTEIRQLRERGAEIFQGHAPEQMRAAQPTLIAYSSAIPTDNPEMILAGQLGIPVIRRAVLLAAILKHRRGVCVAGMHGKTSTAALLAHTLEALEAAPGFAIGAIVPQLGRHARMGAARESFFVAETDESDGTLREFFPEQSIVLNIDEEHLDYYANFKAVCDEFSTFAGQTSGPVFFCADDARLAALYGERKDTVTFGFNPTANYRVEMQPDGGFEVRHGGARLGVFRIRQFGEKNISNAVAVVAFLHHNGFEPADIARALATFRGANRRQQELFADERYRIFDDYGHHPMEIRSTLRAIREECAGRLVVAFQPHRYSRTQHLLSEFADCFGEADLLWVTEVYAASEKPIACVSGQSLAVAISGTGQPAAYAATLDVLREKVRMAMRPGDVVVFLGAGDITLVAHQVAADLQMKRVSHAEAFREMLSAESSVAENEKLASRTTLRVGGLADILIEPASKTDLALALRYCSANALPVFMLGRGSNLVIRDGGIRGVVIALKNDAMSRIEVQGNELHCGAGARLKHIANEARDAGLAGLEFLEGIPGCLGGALRMNAGAMGSATFEVVQRVRVMSRDGQIEERPAVEMGAVYRSCPVLKDHIALGAVLRGVPADSESVRARMEEFRQHRTTTQPAVRSAGCMFKNTEDSPAGRLVDECGLKGLRVGGASVSEVHGNFFVNDGTATAGDMIELLEQVRARVREARGIDLEPEVQIVGE
jgi:UDP-N-acetylmuramate--L-alanine ligase/UDP-N-acetylenolpyruvoylglucosamine reductase